MKLREAISALKKMRDVRIDDTLMFHWLSELDGRVQTEIMLAEIADVFGYSVDQYDAQLLVLPPHDGMYIDWLMWKTADYYAEFDRAKYHEAQFERKYKKYAAWYMNQYRPAARRRKEQERWISME